MERVMISIDGSNLYNMLKAPGLKASLDFGRFVDKLRGDDFLLRKRQSLDLVKYAPGVFHRYHPKRIIAHPLSRVRRVRAPGRR